MHHIFISGIFVFFVCCMSMDETGMKSTPPMKTHQDKDGGREPKRKTGLTRVRHAKHYEFNTTLSDDQLTRLQSLRLEIDDFLVTYERPVFVTTIRTVQTIRPNRKRWRTNSKSHPTSAPYFTKRTYPKPRERMSMFYIRFLDLFSEDDARKRKILTEIPYKDGKTGACYASLFSIFLQYCNYTYYTLGGMSKMKALLARLCLADWVTEKKVIHVLKNTCQRRFQFNTFRWTSSCRTQQMNA